MECVVWGKRPSPWLTDVTLSWTGPRILPTFYTFVHETSHHHTYLCIAAGNSNIERFLFYLLLAFYTSNICKWPAVIEIIALYADGSTAFFLLTKKEKVIDRKSQMNHSNSKSDFNRRFSRPLEEATELLMVLLQEELLLPDPIFFPSSQKCWASNLLLSLNVYWNNFFR